MCFSREKVLPRVTPRSFICPVSGMVASEGFNGSRSVFFKSCSTSAVLWVVENMQSLNERLASLAIRGEKMKEKRLMTDFGTMSGEDLLDSEEISFLTSSDVIRLKVLIAGASWRRGPEGGGTAWKRVSEIGERILSIFSLKNVPNWKDICRHSFGE